MLANKELQNLYRATLMDLLIIKATRNKRLIQMENRLNNKLRKVSNELVRKLMSKDELYVNPSEHTNELTNMYKDYFKEIYLIGEREILARPYVEFTNSIIDPVRLSNLIDERTFNACEATLERLTGDVMPTIETAIREGVPYEATARELETQFVDMSHAQLTRISRTETHTVYNRAKFDVMMESQIVTGKKWLSSGLDNMRDWHSEVDGQIVPVDEPFIVMDEELMYPGDPLGSPENIINCACTMTDVVGKLES